MPPGWPNELRRGRERRSAHCGTSASLTGELRVSSPTSLRPSLMLGLAVPFVTRFRQTRPEVGFMQDEEFKTGHSAVLPGFLQERLGDDAKRRHDVHVGF